jgi:hypothetical protein
MGYGFEVTRVALGAAALLIIAAPAAAEPREPLIVTRLPDPDPNYVASVEPKGETRGANETDANSRVEEAMESFGRAIGEAELVEQQQIDALCKAGAPVNATREQLFAYEASCRYSRH